MNKGELIKELVKLRDIKNYAESELINIGYRTAMLDALDLVKKLTIPDVVGQSEQLCDKCEREKQLQILSKQAQDLNMGYD